MPKADDARNVEGGEIGTTSPPRNSAVRFIELQSPTKWPPPYALIALLPVLSLALAAGVFAIATSNGMAVRGAATAAILIIVLLPPPLIWIMNRYITGIVDEVLDSAAARRQDLTWLFRELGESLQRTNYNFGFKQ